MFFRSSNNVTGLGIGLYIVKEALHKIGGNITVQSQKGMGTTFKVIVPNKKMVEQPHTSGQLYVAN